MLARLSRLAPVWLTVVFGLLTLGPLLLLAYYAITRSSDAVEREATARVQSTAAVSADFVRAELDGLVGVVDAYARRPSLIAALEKGDQARYDVERIAFHLKDLREARPGIDVSGLTDASGILIDVVPATPSIVGDDFSSRDWYRGVTRTRRPYVSEAFLNAATGSAVVSAAAFVVGGTPRRPLGILVAAYSVDFIQSFADRIARHQDVGLTITDQAGAIVASPGGHPRKLVSIADDARVQAALRGENGVLRHTGKGGADVAAYTPVTKHGWTVIASVPREKAFASVRGLRNAVLSIAALLGLVLAGGIAALGLTLRRRAQLEARERSSRVAAENARSELENQNIELEAQANELAAQARRLEESQAQLASANEDLATQHGELERAHAFSERLAQETDVAALAPCILEQIGDVAHADIGTLHAVDLDGNLEIVARRVAGADESLFALTDDGALARVLADGKTVAAHGETGSMLYVPLIHSSRPLGVVTLGRLTDGPFAAGEREEAEHFADQAGVALANAFALRDVQRLADVNRAVLDATTDAIRMVDLEGRTVLANTAMRQMSGAVLTLAQEMPIWDSSAELAERTTDPVAYREANQRLTADPEREAVDVYQIAESGAWIQRYSGPVRNADGLVVGRIFVVRDITVERDAQQLKSDLVATVSHELRTPLTGILGFAELLAMHDVDEESRRSYVETIQREAKRLSNLINDFLDLQRIEEGSFRLELEPVALAELLREQVSLFEAHSSVHSIQLELEDGVNVLGERDRLAQVIANLLSNAIKYSPEGGVVGVRARGAGANVRVEVTDSGIGIPHDQQRRIFEKFFRVDSTDTRRIGGTGLGLALSRDIVEAHGGTIGFSSVDGRGTTFWFELPSVERDAIGSQPAVRPRVLVVEDNAGTAELLKEQLAEDGYDVEVALTGEEALARIGQSPPAVICLDIGLAGHLDGWEVLTRLKAAPETASIPVLVCAGGERKDRAVALGAADFLTKPFSRERLLESVARLVPSGRGSILIVDDEVAIRRLVMATLARDGLDLREASDGVEALARIAEQRPDVIVLDLSMPNLDGFAVLERLLEQPETRTIPVILLTARHVTPEERARLRDHTVKLLQKSAYSAQELRRLVLDAAA